MRADLGDFQRVISHSNFFLPCERILPFKKSFSSVFFFSPSSKEMNYLLMAIEVEGKIFSTGNNPSLQRLMDLWEGSHHTCSSNRWKNVFDLIDWNFYPNRTMFFSPPSWLKIQTSNNRNGGRRIYQSPSRLFDRKFFDGSSSLIRTGYNTPTDYYYIPFFFTSFNRIRWAAFFALFPWNSFPHKNAGNKP